MAATARCPRCGAEYRPGFSTCADCHVELIDHPPERSKKGRGAPDPNRRFVELARVPALEASMIVNRLRVEGIGTANLAAEPIYRSFSFTEGVSILVAEDELALAQEILTGLDEEQRSGS